MAWKVGWRCAQRLGSIHDMLPHGFQTPRLLLRPIGMADAEPIFDRYTQDPEVSRYMTWRPHTSIAQTRAYVNTCLAAADDRTYVLMRRTDNAIIGALDLRQSGPARLGYGYVLARASWGQGLMTEALAEVVDWALRQPSIWRIGDVCNVENLPSARVMEKAGLAREGILRRWEVHPNLGDLPQDCFSYAKVR
ncbi:GNAT family N-acetyltransferase [Muricoccus radiodurans]|uniref:GNAT family N-acetyltransferase n=1 Tax=Muricoccus radiodurans TaxID=2231721 RepID=UPI003CEEBB8E